MAHHQLPEYDDQSDNWKAYITKVEAYFEATGVSDSGKKRMLLVAALSTRTVQVLSGQVAPRKPNSLTYEEAVKVLDAYFDPKRHEITESYRFFNRCQLEGPANEANEWPLPLPEATVYARNFGRGEKWTPGIVESTTGSRMVSIRTPAGSVRRHVDQVRDREDATPPFGKYQEAAKRDSRTGTPSDYPLLPRTPAEQGGITEPEHELQPELAGSNAEPVRSPQALRRSTRQRKPVQRLHY
ncbi:uncharacterized protein LOC144095449 [Amblyomma americanum]